MPRSRWAGRVSFGVVVALILASAGATLSAQLSPTVVSACVHRMTGNVRILLPGAPCQPNEYAMQWNLTGPQGPKGDKGDQGVAGPKGDPGVAGAKGDPGAQGPKGDQGAIGAKGDQGIPGVKGDPGAMGPKGDQGATGVKGDQGIAGAKGDTGPEGLKGDTGPQGLKGDPGVANGVSTAVYGSVDKDGGYVDLAQQTTWWSDYQYLYSDQWLYIVELLALPDQTKPPACVVSPRSNPGVSGYDWLHAQVAVSRIAWSNAFKRWRLYVSSSQVDASGVLIPLKQPFDFICVQR